MGFGNEIKTIGEARECMDCVQTFVYVSFAGTEVLLEMVLSACVNKSILDWLLTKAEFMSLYIVHIIKIVLLVSC